MSSVIESEVQNGVSVLKIDDPYGIVYIDGAIIREVENSETYEYHIEQDYDLGLEIIYDTGDAVRFIIDPWDDINLDLISQVTKDDYNDRYDWHQYVQNLYKKLSQRKTVTIFPLFVYEHGCTHLYTEHDNTFMHHKSWDSRHIGYVYIDRWKNRRIKSDEMAIKDMSVVIDNINKYIAGEVYVVTKYKLNKCQCCKNIEKKELDSICGIMGNDVEDVLKEAKDCFI